MKHVAIIGGGITGLTAAYLLEQQRKAHPDALDYLLIEKENRLGGIVRTEKVDGFTIEGGPDSFISRKPEVMWLSKRLGIDSRVMGTNMKNSGSYIVSNNKIYTLPAGVAMLLPFKFTDFAKNPLISWPGKIRAGCDLFIPAKPNNEDESLASFINRRLGKEMLEKVVGPLVGGIHSNDPATMSLRATFPRFLEMEREDRSLMIAILKMKSAMKKRMKKTGPPTGRRSPFLTFQNGMTELTSAIEKELNPANIRKGTGVIAVEKGDHTRYRLRLQDGEPLEVDGVILALGANHASTMLEPFDQDLAHVLHQIPFTSSASISLAYRNQDLPDFPRGFGITVPVQEKRSISAITFSSLKWERRVPDDQYLLMRIFVGGYANPDLVFLDEERLMKMVKQDLKEMLGITAEPLLHRIYRWKYARPQYSMGHLDRVQEIEERVGKEPGLDVAGCSYHGAGLSDSIASGMGAAKKVIHDLGFQPLELGQP